MTIQSLSDITRNSSSAFAGPTIGRAEAYFDGPIIGSELPTVMDSGQSIGYWGRPGVVIDGGIGIGPSLISPLYIEVEMQGPVTYAGAEFVLNTGVGLATSFAMPAWFETKLQNRIGATGTHLYINRGEFGVDLWDLDQQNPMLKVMTQNLAPKLAAGTVYRVEWWRQGDFYTLRLPSGQVRRKHTPGCAARTGAYLNWEWFSTDGESPTEIGTLLRFWGGSDDPMNHGLRDIESAYSFVPSVDALPKPATSNEPAVTTLSFPEYPSIPTSPTVISDDFVVYPKPGATGKCLIELYGFVKTLPSNGSLRVGFRGRNDLDEAKLDVYVIPNTAENGQAETSSFLAQHVIHEWIDALNGVSVKALVSSIAGGTNQVQMDQQHQWLFRAVPM